jgi:putative hemolysin
MQISVTLFSWFIGVLNGSGLALLRILRVPEAHHRHIYSPEEIELLLAESTQRGVLEAEDQERLRRALRLGWWSSSTSTAALRASSRWKT